MSLVDCCRLCLKNLIDVALDEDSHYTITDDRNLQNMIFEFFQILILDGEIISKICSRCNDQVRTIDKIRMRVKRADLEVKQYYASLIIKQEEDIIEEVLDQTEDPDQRQVDLQEPEQEDDNFASLDDDDAISNDNSTKKYEFIEIKPDLDYDATSMEMNSSESQSESEQSLDNEPRKKRKTTVKKVDKTTDSKCYICDTDCDTVDALDSHLSSHVGSTAQVCHLCEQTVPTVRFLNMHLKRFHFRKGERLPCEECKKDNIVKEFASTFKLQVHIRTVHEGIVEIPKKVHVCTYCGKSFARGTSLRVHENIHTKAILHKCQQCPFTTVARSGLIRHLRVHTAEKPFKCDECDASFNQSNGLHAHKAGKHSNERPFSCDICGDERRFKTKYTLQYHMRSHQKPKEPKELRHSSVVVMGTEVPITERELKCNFCPAVYSYEKFLCGHIVEKHPDEKVPMLGCELCQNTNKKAFFLTQAEKDRHLARHKRIDKRRELKERVCPDCGEVFQTNEAYQRHRQKHYKLECKECGKTFQSKSALNLHLLTIHLKRLPYKCDKCDSAFGQLTSLTAHLKVHEKPPKAKKRSTKG